MPVFGTPFTLPAPTSGLSSEWQWIAEMIEEEGRTLTLRKAQSLTDPDQPWKGNLNFSELVVTGVICRYKRTQVDGSLILKTDKQALIAPLASVAIEEYDLLVDTGGDGKTYKIIRPEKIQPGTENLLYILQLRR